MASSADQRQLAAALRAQGHSWVQIAEALRARWPTLNALASLRLAHGWTQDDAANAWNDLFDPPPFKTRQDIGIWEIRRPGFSTLEKLARLYECNLGDLLADWPGYRHLDDEAIPAGDVQLATVLPDEFSLPTERAAGLGVELWELHEVLQSQRVSREVMDLAERASAHLDARFTELPPAVLFREVGHQFTHVVGWLREPQPVRYRQRLCSLAGRLAGLRAWLYFDMAEHDAAEAWFIAGLSAAREADDHDLCGWLLGAQSLIPIDRQDYQTAHGLIEQAQALAGHAGSQTTRAWLMALEARALAGLGDSQGFAIAEQRLQKRLAHSRLEDGRHGMDFAGETLDVTYYQGLSHLLLHQAQAAWGSFQTALDNLPESNIKARAMLLASLAMAAAQNQQLDNAAAKTSEALSIAADQPIRRVWQRANDVRRALEPASGTTMVHALDDQMAMFAGTLEQANSEPST